MNMFYFLTKKLIIQLFMIKKLFGIFYFSILAIKFEILRKNKKSNFQWYFKYKLY